jgi:glycosyltransferase involved in cell wall biosynthesis
LTVDSRPPAVAGKRVILDISSIAQWVGPAVGILRVEQALARYALAQQWDIIFSFYDKTTGSFHCVNSRWAPYLVSWKGKVGRRRGVPLSLLPSAYTVVDALERMRLACSDGKIARGIERLQQVVLLARRRRRRGVVPFRVAIGRPLVLGPRDVLLSTGSDWTHKDAVAIAALKKQFNFRYVVMCYDIIPLLFPQYYSPRDVHAFRHYWTSTFPVADRILVNSCKVATDIASYCERKHLSVAERRIVPLGCDLTGSTSSSSLPKGLEPDRFILFVSTIEPRKGHRILLRVWRRLLAITVPQRHYFKLVFVGRAGWLVDDVLDQVNANAFDGTLVHLTGIGDDELASLYRAAAFCVYPSEYEGFGLPIVEAFSYGRAVLASTGGALPETVGGFSPCLDPTDDDAWFETMKGWIEHPSLRHELENRIRASFSWPTWDQAAAQIIEAASCTS